MPKKPRNLVPSLLVVYPLFKGPSDSKILRMVIDTGATTTIIPPKVAVAIGCDPAESKQRMSIITASGTEYLPVVKVPLVRCLGGEVRMLPVVCHDLPAQSTIDGLLGLDFLDRIPAFQEFRRAVSRLTH